MRNFIFIIIFTAFFIRAFSQVPSIAWQFDLKDMSFGSACAADLDNDGKLEIVFSTYFNDGNIYALNSEDGSLLWKYDVGGCSDAAPVICDVDGNGTMEVILHSSCVPKIFCFNGSDGSVKWKINSRATDSPPSVADIDNDGNTEIFDGDFGGYVSCYNGEDGSLEWETLVDSNYVIQTEPVLSDLDNDGELDLTIATYNLTDTNFSSKCFIVAYKAKDGSLLWKNTERTYSIYHGPTVADVDNDSNPEVLISDYGGILYCLNGENGSTSWTYKFSDGGYSGTPTTIADLNNDGKYEIIYFCDDRLGVLSGEGKLLWGQRMLFGLYTFRGAIVTDIDGDNALDIIFGNNAGWLTAINGQNGGLIWSMDFEEIYGKRFDLLHGLLASDFNKDGMIDIFFIGGWAQYPEIEKNYGRAYLITAGVGKGPDWLMFRRTHKRNAVIPINVTDVIETNSSDNGLIVNYIQDTDILKIEFDNMRNPEIIELIDILGNRISTLNVSGKTNIEADCGNLAVGLYFLRLKTCDDYITASFFKY